MEMPQIMEMKKACVWNGNAAKIGKNICRTIWTTCYIGEVFVPRKLDGAREVDMPQILYGVV